MLSLPGTALIPTPISTGKGQESEPLEPGKSSFSDHSDQFTRMKRQRLFRIASAISMLIYLLTSSLSVEAVVPEKNRIPLSSLQENDISTHSEVRKNLLSLDDWINKRDRKGIKRTIDNLKAFRLNWGSRNLPFIADFIRSRGHYLVNLGEYDLGIFLIEQAKDAFPEDYNIRFALTKIYWSVNSINVSKGYSDLKEGLWLYLSSILRRYQFVYFSIILFSFSLIISIYFYFAILLLKNYKIIICDIIKIIGFNLKSATSSILSIVIILIPWIMGGVFVFILAIPVWIWPYLKSFNKVIVTIFTAFLLFFPVITGHAIEEAIKYNSVDNEKIDDFSQKIWDTETLNYFKTRMGEEKHGFFYNTSIGLIYKWMGDFEKYYLVFKKLNHEKPNDVTALINLGNSMFLAGKLDEAMKLYQNAMMIAPNSVEAHYNLSLVLEGDIKFVEAKQEYLKAYAIDPNTVQRLLHEFLAQKTYNNVQPMDKIPDIPKFEAIKNFQILSTELNEDVLGFLLIPVLRKESLVPFTASLFFLTLLMAWRYKKLKKPSAQCGTCGTVFDREMECPLCMTMNACHTRLDPKKREMASMKIWRHSIIKKTVQTLFNIILPGSSLLFDDADLSGFILIFLTLSLVICGIFFFIFSLQPRQLDLVIIILAGYYLIINLFFAFQIKIWHLKEI